MKGLEKSEFKKLNWKDNATKIGKDNGLIYFIGRFNIGTKTFMEYRVSNSFGALDIKPYFMVSCDFQDFGSFGGVSKRFYNLKDAKYFCQLHFEEFIKNTFYETRNN
jgi:hypothetical protein